MITIYKTLLEDSEPEVRSEACNNLVKVSEHCSPQIVCEKIMPILTASIVSDKSPHVRGTLAQVIC